MEWSWVDAEDVRGSGGDVLRRVGQEFGARIGLLLHARRWQDDSIFVDSGGMVVGSITAENLIPSCETGSRWINTGLHNADFPHSGGSRGGIP